MCGTTKCTSDASLCKRQDMRTVFTFETFWLQDSIEVGRSSAKFVCAGTKSCLLTYCSIRGEIL